MSPQEPTTIAVSADHLYEISRIVTQAERWNKALDQIVPLVRKLIIFDNLAVYLADPVHHNLDVMYARAIGRGRSKEADISWGEDLANSIMDDPQVTVREPDDIETDNRLKRPYLLGIPMQFGGRPLGAVVYIRFGGPPFQPEYIRLGEFIGQQIGLLVERQNLVHSYELLEQESQEARLQEDFVSTISHELRTPLGFIKGYTTTLLRADTTWDQSTQNDFLQIIDQETDRLQELIENLLDSARLQTGTLKMDLQAVRLDTLVRSVVSHTNLYHPEFEASLDFPANVPTIQGDPKRLGQVIENLFTNAIKYAQGSSVSVKISFGDREAIINIADGGPGIPNRYLPHMFKRFFRNPDVAPSVHGSGLGLFICKKIIQAHHGDITVTSQVGKGTTFHIHLPIAQEKSGAGLL